MRPRGETFLGGETSRGELTKGQNVQLPSWLSS